METPKTTTVMPSVFGKSTLSVAFEQKISEWLNSDDPEKVAKALEISAICWSSELKKPSLMERVLANSF